MKKIICFLMCIMALSAVTNAATKKKKLHTIGDSTMQNYSESTTTQRGWAQMLQPFFDVDNIIVNNRGKAGASSKSFYKEDAYWKTLKTGGNDQMSEGDLLVIQFAHNDEKNGGADGDMAQAYYDNGHQNEFVDKSTGNPVRPDYRGTVANGTFKDYIRKFITEAKAMGVKPIVVGPICRKYFDGNKIKRNGRHDLGDNYTVCDGNSYSTGHKVSADNHDYDYAYQAKMVAYEFDDVPYIDLTSATEKMYLDYGDAYCTNYLFYKTDDSTHPGIMGATLIARLFAQMVKDQAQSEPDAKRKAILQELASDVIVSNEISFNPVSGDMGESYVGMNVTKEFNISAFGLAQESGNISISVTDGFTISTDKTNWSNNLSIPYTGSTLISTIYVRAKIASASKQTGKLTASDGVNSKDLDLSISGISLSGGEPTSCVWALNSTSAAATSTVLSGTDATANEMYLKGTITPESGDYTGKMAYYDIEGSTWPAGEIDELSTRYIQFKATVPTGSEFNLDNISFNVCPWGGNSVCYHAYYATKSDFSDAVMIGQATSMTNKKSVAVSYDAVKKLDEGESVYIRVYPWLNVSSASTGKYIALSDVTIHGVISNGGEQVKLTGSITNAFSNGNGSDEWTFDPMGLGVGFVAKTVKVGSEYKYNGTEKWVGTDDVNCTLTRIQAVDQSANTSSSHSESNSLSFTFTPDDGFYFIPSKVSFDAARLGTNGGKLDVEISAGTNKATVVSGVTPNRSNNSSTLSHYEASVDGVVATADNPLKLDFFIMSLMRQYGFANIVIEGTLEGAASQSTKYEIETSVTPAGAGTIVMEPELASYKAGSNVTLSAQKNFGYRFVEWQDGAGNVLGNSNSLDVTMDANKNVKAVFESVPVYTVTTVCTNDADRSLGSITLIPNDNNGKYEEGTTVVAKANESKIAKFMQWTDGGEDAGTKATRSFTVNSDMKISANYEIQDFIAVFDASAVNFYAYETTDGYPFAADVTWDDQRNAKSSVVKLSDGSLVYSNDGKTVGSAGTPVVRNRNGVVLSGLDGLYMNGYYTTDVAWQYEFSTIGFTSAKLSGEMAAKGNASKNWKALYSLDGTNFNDIPDAKWSATENTILPFGFDLPKDAAGKEKVYVRITGDGNEVFKNVTIENTFCGLDYCGNTASGFGNLYVLGEAEVESDSQAPVMTTSIPESNAEGVSATGNITISYNERIQSGNIVGGKAMLNGEELTPIWNSRSVSFQYGPLEYGKTYTFTYPAGYVEDKSGNKAESVELTFTVMNRQKPQARTFNAIVDHSLNLEHGKKIAATTDMPAQYRYIQDAIDDAPEVNEKPYIIYIKEGYYDDANLTFNQSYGTKYVSLAPENDNTEQIPGGKNEYDDCKLIFINKPNIHIIGQAADKVTIATDRLDGGIHNANDYSRCDHSRVWYHVNAGATVEVYEKGKDFFMQGITLDNENWTIKKMEGPQALCMNITADRAVFDEMNVRSYQDTYKTNGLYNRQYWNNSTIEGSVDFIYGNGDVWFENVKLNINRKEGGYIVAPDHAAETRWGYVFNNTTITSDYWDPASVKIYFGRPWHNNPKTVFLHTNCEVGSYDGYWYPTMGGIPSIWAVYDIKDRNGNSMTTKSIEDYYYKEKDGSKVEGKAKNSLSDEEAAQYTLANVMAGDGTNDADKGRWNPAVVVEKTSKPVLKQSLGVVTWDADEYAICYVVTVNGKPVAFPTEASYTANNGDVISVQSVNEYGALSEMSDPITVNNTVDGITEIGTQSNKISDAIYNISGQRVNKNAKHGIFIMNGKKIIR